MKDFVYRFDDRDRGTVGKFQCVALDWVRLIAFVMQDDIKQFRITLPPLIDGLLDVAHEEEGPVPFVHIVVDRFIRQIGKDLPLLV